MKKRLLLVLLVGISFSPSVFADGNGVGPVARSADLDSPLGSACAANAAQDKQVWDGIMNGNTVQPVSKTKVGGAR